MTNRHRPTDAFLLQSVSDCRLQMNQQLLSTSFLSADQLLSLFHWSREREISESSQTNLSRDWAESFVYREPAAVKLRLCGPRRSESRVWGRGSARGDPPSASGYTPPAAHRNTHTPPTHTCCWSSSDLTSTPDPQPETPWYNTQLHLQIIHTYFFANLWW